MKFLQLLILIFSGSWVALTQNISQQEHYFELANNYFADTKLDSAIKYSQILLDLSSSKQPNTLPEETTFRSYFILGRSWSLKSKYETSNEIWESYFRYRNQKDPNNTDELIGIRCQVASNNFYWRNREGMKTELDRIDRMQQNNPIQDNHIKAYLKFLAGQYQYFTNELDQGIDHLLNSIVLFRKSEDTNSTLMISCISEASNMYAAQGESRKALQMSLYAQSKAAEIFGRDSYKAGKYSNNIGLDYYSIQEYEKAKFYFEDYISIIKKYRGEKDNSLAPAYVNLGLLNDRSNPYKSIQYFHAAERFYLDELGPENRKLTVAYYNLANQYIFIEDLENAKEYANKLEELSLKLTGPEQDFFVISKTLKGKIFANDNNFEKAIAAHEEVEKIYRKHPPNDPMRRIENLEAIGRCFLAISDLEMSKFNFNLALTQLKLLPFQHKIMESNVLGHLALIASEEHSWDSAFNLSDKSMNLLGGHFNNVELEAILKPAIYIERLGNRINLETNYYLTSSKNNLERLKNIQTISLKYLTKLINRIEDREDYSLLRNNARYTTESLLNSLSIIPHDARTSEYYNNILNLIELNKNLSLVSDMNLEELTKVQFSNQEILTQEAAFRSAIKTIRLEIAQTENLQGSESTEILVLQDSLFSLIESQQYFLDALQRDFPAYYEIIYGLDIAKVEELQKELIKTDELLIQYFYGDTTLYVLAISKESCHFDKIEMEEHFEGTVKRFLNHLKGPNHKHLIFNQENCKLYNLLLKNTLSTFENINTLTIINDGLLNYIPFEVLTNDCDPSSSNYVIEDYAISYHLSSSLALKLAQSPDTGPSTFNGFAAEYNQALIPEENAIVMRSEGTNNYQLPGAVKEIEDLHKLIGGDVYLRNQATESNFKRHASSMDIIHLSLHGRVSDYFPMESGLLFHEVDSTNNGILTTNEIYRLDLKTKMAILSACETGVGAYKKGEGIQSISRAFTYAGAQSILYSLWKVPDRTTKAIMLGYYQGLVDGLHKDDALQQSKLAYLKKTVEPEERHPYYWAGFVLQGNTQAITFTSNNNFLTLLIGAMVLGLACFWWYTKNKKST